jgi:dCMP deaminase
VTAEDRPSRDLTLMRTAFVFAQRSTCSRAQVGAVFSMHGRILSTGYNGAPAGMPHCDHSADANSPFAGKDGCQISVHAEANGIAWAARNGVALESSELHTTRVPCRACAQLIINAGVIRVVWYEEHRVMDGLELLMSASVEVLRLT